jgi:hypothetical protein
MGSRRMRWAGHVTYTGKRTGACRLMGGKTEGKRSLGIQWLGLDDNINMNLSRTEIRIIDWIDLAEDRDRWRALVNVATNF